MFSRNRKEHVYSISENYRSAINGHEIRRAAQLAMHLNAKTAQKYEARNKPNHQFACDVARILGVPQSEVNVDFVGERPRTAFVNVGGTEVEVN